MKLAHSIINASQLHPTKPIVSSDGEVSYYGCIMPNCREQPSDREACTQSVEYIFALGQQS